MGRNRKMRVSATHSALKLLIKASRKIWQKINVSSIRGCCDGSAPMCFKEGEFPLGENDKTWRDRRSSILYEW